MLDAYILVPVKRFGVPDILVDHAEPNDSKTELGLTSHQIAERVLEAFFKQQVSAVV
ncbi:MAG: hypothetical protein RMZ69_11130 [Nostoc sp. ChiQUE01a]|nr:hypothetical protein [Nostoc sp. ChiQUE01a]